MEKIFEENKEETENTQFENILSKSLSVNYQIHMTCYKYF